MSKGTWIEVAKEGELDENEMVGVATDGLKVCLAHVQGKYFAINDMCTHFSTRLSEGELFPETLEVQCPLHDSKFSLVDGCPNQVPAERSVQVYPVMVTDGRILIDAGRADEATGQ